MLIRQSNKKTVAVVLFCILSALSLFFDFALDTWHVVDPQSFPRSQYVLQSYVIGRMVKSRQDGIFSAGGLLGYGYRNPEEFSNTFDENTVNIQYLAYSNGEKFDTFWTYKSQNGAQGMLFSLLDRLIPFSPKLKVSIFHGLTSLLFAATLTAVTLWFYWEFGAVVGLFVLVSAVFSQWFVQFGRNLYWSMWAFYLMIITVMYFLRHDRVPTKHRQFWFGVLIFGAVLINCLFNGYLYLTTALIMMMIPYFYYCFLDRVGIRDILRGLLTPVLSSFLAILFSLIILGIQIISVTGSFSETIDYMVFTLEKRTYADAGKLPVVYADSLNASPVAVVMTYLDGTFLDLNNYFHTSNPVVSEDVLRIRYWYLILLFAIASVYIILRAARKRKVAGEQGRRNLSLVWATWLSILAPLSWLIIFKAHSFIHTHLNPIVWQMPFTLFGFAVCGLAIRSIGESLGRFPRRSA